MELFDYKEFTNRNIGFVTEEEQDILGDIEALGGVRKFPVRIKCALLSWVGLDDALADHLKK